MNVSEEELKATEKRVWDKFNKLTSEEKTAWLLNWVKRKSEHPMGIEPFIVTPKESRQ